MNTAIGIASPISALLTTAYFVHHPIDTGAVKAHLTHFCQWCSRSDYMDVIAVLMVLGVILVNRMGYWL